MRTIFLSILIMLAGIYSQAQSHPSIMLTQQHIAAVRRGVEDFPVMASSFKTVKKDADKALKSGIEVPTPADGGGGVTHEKHKKNYQQALACGIAFQITKDERYARYVKELLLQYAAVYNTWGRHPKRKQEPGGKIFWQNLNDCVWQVYMIQAYDCVYNAIPAADRKKIEEDLFASVVKELSVVNGSIFNKVHNHGTWSVAAVGMTGYVTGRKEWVQQALHGTKLDDKGGFLAQLNQLFSPDGYYAEGPYYQRYAILPFMLFAKAIHQYEPGFRIYDFRSGLLKKAVNTALQCTYTNKVFFPLNDAIKDKTYETEEMVYAVNIAYSDMQAGDDLLDIAQQQERVIISDAGLSVAKAIAAGKTKPFAYKPQWINDGADGKGGGIGILRSGPNSNQLCVVMKAGTQGMGHGHFDRLNLLVYDNNGEVFSDYGAVRFLNVETKNGGNYTKENDTWGKQTVAHNTLVVDEQSHFNNNEKIGEEFTPSLVNFTVNNRYQVVSAEEKNAYKGTNLWRSAILFTPDEEEQAILIDVFAANSQQPHQYDLPFWYQGHVTDLGFPAEINKKQLSALGRSDGYQHIWLNGSGIPSKGKPYITVLNNRKFYTTSFVADTATRVKLLTLGADDPNLNLRTEKAFMLTQPAATSHTFISITEPHGRNNTIAEVTTGAKAQVKDLTLLSSTNGIIQFIFAYKKKTYKISIRRNEPNSFLVIE
ncbi:MAG: heparinase II/III domain-containing protein [Pseudobacter sp.]|uniref:heparinase II/III domain-containing protein n=1 Tax=Pseudobacter sp. TaxID=2045420 RepID=UPI003F7D89F5